MKFDDVSKAIAEAERFIEIAKKVKQATHEKLDGKKWMSPQVEPGMDAAAARRASMDLTRALSAMRRRS